eukprot:2308259-Rhodomonas_salina.1
MEQHVGSLSVQHEGLDALRYLLPSGAEWEWAEARARGSAMVDMVLKIIHASQTRHSQCPQFASSVLSLLRDVSERNPQAMLHQSVSPVHLLSEHELVEQIQIDGMHVLKNLIMVVKDEDSGAADMLRAAHQALQRVSDLHSGSAAVESSCTRLRAAVAFRQDLMSLVSSRPSSPRSEPLLAADIFGSSDDDDGGEDVDDEPCSPGPQRTSMGTLGSVDVNAAGPVDTEEQDQGMDSEANSDAESTASKEEEEEEEEEEDEDGEDEDEEEEQGDDACEEEPDQAAVTAALVSGEAPPALNQPPAPAPVTEPFGQGTAASGTEGGYLWINRLLRDMHASRRGAGGVPGAAPP